MRTDEDLRRLDGLIAAIGGSDSGTESPSHCGLLLEHLRAARRNLMGAMRGEYGLSLQQATESVACIADKAARTETKNTLQSLIKTASPKSLGNT